MEKKQIIIFIVSSALLIVSIVGADIFYYQSIKMEKELSTLHQTVRDLEAQEKRLLEVRQTAAVSGIGFENLNKYFVDENGALDFVKYIENLAVSSGLTFKIDFFDSQQDSVLAENGKEYLKTAIRTTGSLNNIRIFLNLIESLPYNVKINRVDVRKNGEGARDWGMTVDFSVVKVSPKAQ